MHPLYIIHGWVPFFVHLKRSQHCQSAKNTSSLDFPSCPVVEKPPANAGAQVQPLVWEHSSHRQATKPVGHNYWTHMP